VPSPGDLAEHSWCARLTEDSVKRLVVGTLPMVESDCGSICMDTHGHKDKIIHTRMIKINSSKMMAVVG
jgi:hypothetical protein